MILILLLIPLFFFYLNNYYSDIDVVKINKEKFLVRDLPDKYDAAELLLEIGNRLEKLINFLEKTHPKLYERLKTRFKKNKLSEGTLDYKYTTYTVNKGEQMVFCLRSRESDKLHHLNILMFVAIHELAHVASHSEGHTSEFKENFKLLLQQAIKSGVYINEKFSENPKSYCGTLINNNGM